MAYVTEAQVYDHLSLTTDMAAAEIDLLGSKLAAAQGHVERLLGYRLADRFIDPADEPDEGDDRTEFPADLREAILQLVAHWFEHRETVGQSAQVMPFGTRDIIMEHREFTF